MDFPFSVFVGSQQPPQDSRVCGRAGLCGRFLIVLFTRTVGSCSVLLLFCNCLICYPHSELVFFPVILRRKYVMWCKRIYKLNSKISSSIGVLNIVLGIARDLSWCLSLLSSQIPAIHTTWSFPFLAFFSFKLNSFKEQGNAPDPALRPYLDFHNS